MVEGLGLPRILGLPRVGASWRRGALRSGALALPLRRFWTSSSEDEMLSSTFLELFLFLSLLRRWRGSLQGLYSGSSVGFGFRSASYSIAGRSCWESSSS